MKIRDLSEHDHVAGLTTVMLTAHDLCGCVGEAVREYFDDHGFPARSTERDRIHLAALERVQAQLRNDQ